MQQPRMHETSISKKRNLVARSIFLITRVYIIMKRAK